MMQQPNPMSATGIGAIARGMPQGQPQKPLSPTAGIGNVADRIKAYGPQGLEQRNAISEDLLNLIAAQKLKSEKEAALRDMQMQAAQQGQPITVAQSLDKELMQMTKAEMSPQQAAPQVAGASQQQAQQQQAAMQKLMQGIARAPGAQQMPGMAAGGIVAFQEGGEVDPREIERILRKSPFYRTPEENALLEKAGFKLQRKELGEDSAVMRASRALEQPFIREATTGGAYKLSPEELAQRTDTAALNEKLYRALGGKQYVSDTGDETTRLQSRFPAPQQAAPQQTAPTAPQAPNAPQQGAPAMRMPPAQVTSKVPAALGAGIAQGPAAQVLKPGAMGQGISPGPLEQATEQSAIDLAKMRPRAEIEAARQRRSQTIDPALQADRAERERALKEFEAFTKPDPERQKREAIYAMLRGYAQPIPGGGGISQFLMNAGAAGNRYQQAQRDTELKNMLERQRRRGEITGADVKSAEELFKAGEDTYQPSLQAQAAGARVGTDLLTSRQTAATAAADRASREREAAANRAVQLKIAEIQAKLRQGGAFNEDDRRQIYTAVEKTVTDELSKDAQYLQLKRKDPNAAEQRRIQLVRERSETLINAIQGKAPPPPAAGANPKDPLGIR